MRQIFPGIVYLSVINQTQLNYFYKEINIPLNLDHRSKYFVRYHVILETF